jgi:hypothetical protein
LFVAGSALFVPFFFFLRTIKAALHLFRPHKTTYPAPSPQLIGAERVKTLTEHGKKGLEGVAAPVWRSGFFIFLYKRFALARRILRALESRVQLKPRRFIF